MTCDDPALDGNDPDDFQRWYFGGSPPEGDRWESVSFDETSGGTRAVAGHIDREPKP